MQLMRASLAVLFVWGMVAAGRPGVARAQDPGAPLKPAGVSSYVLGPGDQILVRAANAPELNEKAIRIDLSGYITLPIVGRVQAGGTTVETLETELHRRLKVFLEEPDVSVSVMEYQSQPVSVFGEVAVPGVHQLQGRKSLVELLAITGGVKSDAGPLVMITRRMQYGRVPLPGAADDPSGKFSIAQIELKPLIQARTPQYDITIQPYDIISIPHAEFIYIAGDVLRSGTQPLIEKTTISIVEALSTAGGLTRTADPKKARILRSTKANAIRPQEPVNIAKILHGDSEDVQLMAGDILVIPSSNTKKAAQRALEAAIQIGSVILSSGVVNGTL